MALVNHITYREERHTKSERAWKIQQNQENVRNLLLTVICIYLRRLYINFFSSKAKTLSSLSSTYFFTGVYCRVCKVYETSDDKMEIHICWVVKIIKTWHGAVHVGRHLNRRPIIWPIKTAASVPTGNLDSIKS